MEHLQELPTDMSVIRKATSRHPILACILQFVRSGWPTECKDAELQPFISRKTELSVQSGCLLWGNRVVVPPSVQSTVLMELHTNHPGVSRIKTLNHLFAVVRNTPN